MALPAQGENITFSPILMISQKYTDNFYKSQEQTEEEWITSYHLGAVAGFKGKKVDFFLEYAPEYKDYYYNNQKDDLEHNARALLRSVPFRETQIEAMLVYDGHGTNEERQDWSHHANLSLETQLTKTFTLLMEENYSRQFQRQQRTGLYKEYDRNTSRLEIQRNFGEKNSMSLYGEYRFVDYDQIDQDTNESYKIGTDLQYWFTRLDGMETNLSYQEKLFDHDMENLGDKDSVLTGYIKYIRRINPRMEGFAKYRHYYSERGENTHHVFHPSVGINWNITEDSGISIGVGALFNQWNNENEDDVYPFLELDIYKEISFSPRGSILFTAASRYDSGDEMASSLGYNTVYEGAVQLSYQFTRRLSYTLGGRCQYQEFHEKRVNRSDQRVSLNAGLMWRPIEWLLMGLDLSYEQIFSENDIPDYRENSVFIYARFLPKNPDKSNPVPEERRLLDSPFEKARSRNLSQ